MFQARAPVDLSNPRLRRLASALGPAYVRVSGTWANSVFFSNADSPPAEAPAGFQGVLSRTQWKGGIDFTRARCSGNRSEAAKTLGINRQLLYAKLKKYGLAEHEEEIDADH